MKRRTIFNSLTKWLENEEICFLVGARQVGKTTLLKQLQTFAQEQEIAKTNDIFFYNLEDFDVLQSFNESPKNLLADLGAFQEGKKKIVFIDEIQYLDDPSHFLKYIFDAKKEQVKLIVSGSSSFYLDKKFQDSLAGRKIIFEIHPLSFPEFLEFKDQQVPNNFKKLPDFRKPEYLTLLAEYALHGGYPRVVIEEDVSKKPLLLSELINSYLKKDVLEQNIRDAKKFYDFLKLLARHTGALYNKNEMAHTLGCSATAIENYSYILEKTFFIHPISPFSNNLRKELTKMPKIFFADTGIRNILLSNFQPFSKRLDRGELFENLCFRLLQEKNSEIGFWRTQDKKEIDFILPGKREAIEVKWSSKKTGKNRYKDSFLELYPSFVYQEINFENCLEGVFCS